MLFQFHYIGCCSCDLCSVCEHIYSFIRNWRLIHIICRTLYDDCTAHAYNSPRLASAELPHPNLPQNFSFIRIAAAQVTVPSVIIDQLITRETDSALASLCTRHCWTFGLQCGTAPVYMTSATNGVIADNCGAIAFCPWWLLNCVALASQSVSCISLHSKRS